MIKPFFMRMDEELLLKFKIRCLKAGVTCSTAIQRLIYNSLHQDKIKVWEKEDERRGRPRKRVDL